MRAQCPFASARTKANEKKPGAERAAGPPVADRRHGKRNVGAPSVFCNAHGFEVHNSLASSGGTSEMARFVGSKVEFGADTDEFALNVDARELDLANLG